MCGERRRGRDKCLETDNWVILLIFECLRRSNQQVDANMCKYGSDVSLTEQVLIYVHICM